MKVGDGKFYSIELPGNRGENTAQGIPSYSGYLATRHY
jgi:hypothetical protein